MSVQEVQLLPLRNIWRHISLIWPFPHRYRQYAWPVDVTELFPRFCCWTLIWLSRHWAWLCRGYWRYWRLIDWFIDFLKQSFVPTCSQTCYLPGAKCPRNLGVIFAKLSLSSYIYQQCAAHASITCGVCGVFAVTLIWIVQNSLQLLLCLVVLIIAIHFCMV